MKPGIALIAGSAGMLIVMAFHPSAHDYDAHRMTVVHVLAVATIPLSFYGAMALGDALALTVFAVGLISGVFAAGVSLAIPNDAEFFRHDAVLVQAFARIIVSATSVAIVLWSARMRGVLRAYGIAAGTIAVALLFAGHLRLDAHGFGLVTLSEAIWFIAAGARMLRVPSASPSRSRAA